MAIFFYSAILFFDPVFHHYRHSKLKNKYKIYICLYLLYTTRRSYLHTYLLTYLGRLCKRGI